jgi:hypothetical protein
METEITDKEVKLKVITTPFKENNFTIFTDELFVNGRKVHQTDSEGIDLVVLKDVLSHLGYKVKISQQLDNVLDEDLE